MLTVTEMQVTGLQIHANIGFFSGIETCCLARGQEDKLTSVN